MEPEPEPDRERRAALVEAMLSNSPDTRHAQLETHVTAMSEEELLVLEELDMSFNLLLECLNIQKFQQ